MRPCSATRLLHAHGALAAARRAAGPLPRVAMVAPIYNEDTERVFAGLRAMWEDLRAQPQSDRVDLLILSDTTDPDIWLAELDAWQRLRQAVPGAERIYYRRRLRNLKRKTGNIEDFFTRWGGAYGYMIVLDADSLMSGRRDDAAGRAHGRQSGGRADPGAAQARPRPDRVRAHAAVRGRALRPAVRRRPQLLGAGRRATTGATTRSSASRRSPSCAACRCCPAGPRSAARS